MTKLFKIVLLSVLSCVLFVGCGEGWEQTKKNFHSNYSGGLYRKVVVENAWTKEIVWEYEGLCYMDGNSTPGNVTIVFRGSHGERLKCDFVGQFFLVSLIEYKKEYRNSASKAQTSTDNVRSNPNRGLTRGFNGAVD